MKSLSVSHALPDAFLIWKDAQSAVEQKVLRAKSLLEKPHHSTIFRAEPGTDRRKIERIAKDSGRYLENFYLIEMDDETIAVPFMNQKTDSLHKEFSDIIDGRDAKISLIHSRFNVSYLQSTPLRHLINESFLIDRNARRDFETRSGNYIYESDSETSLTINFNERYRQMMRLSGNEYDPEVASISIRSRCLSSRFRVLESKTQADFHKNKKKHDFRILPSEFITAKTPNGPMIIGGGSSVEGIDVGGYVYISRVRGSGEDGPWKVGYTSQDPIHRNISGSRTSTFMNQDAELVFAIACEGRSGEDLENSLHKMLSSARIQSEHGTHSEWFALPLATILETVALTAGDFDAEYKFTGFLDEDALSFPIFHDVWFEHEAKMRIRIGCSSARDYLPDIHPLKSEFLNKLWVELDRLDVFAEDVDDYIVVDVALAFEDELAELIKLDMDFKLNIDPRGMDVSVEPDGDMFQIRTSYGEKSFESGFRIEAGEVCLEEVDMSPSFG